MNPLRRTPKVASGTMLFVLTTRMCGQSAKCKRIVVRHPALRDGVVPKMDTAIPTRRSKGTPGALNSKSGRPVPDPPVRQMDIQPGFEHDAPTRAPVIRSETT